VATRLQLLPEVVDVTTVFATAGIAGVASLGIGAVYAGLLVYGLAACAGIVLREREVVARSERSADPRRRTVPH
jgi:hypothetical protein